MAHYLWSDIGLFVESKRKKRGSGPVKVKNRSYECGDSDNLVNDYFSNHDPGHHLCFAA